VITAEAVLSALRDVAYRTMEQPTVLRCAADVAIDAHALALAMTYPVPHTMTEWERWAIEESGDPGLRGAAVLFMERYDLVSDPNRLLGLRIVEDPYLTRGAWRLCTDAGVALYDWRTGRPRAVLP
jgi:hypothetical protein